MDYCIIINVKNYNQPLKKKVSENEKAKRNLSL